MDSLLLQHHFGIPPLLRIILAKGCNQVDGKYTGGGKYFLLTIIISLAFSSRYDVIPGKGETRIQFLLEFKAFIAGVTFITFAFHRANLKKLFNRVLIMEAKDVEKAEQSETMLAAFVRAAFVICPPLNEQVKDNATVIT
ncbi:hypothetical protein KIN20_009014 [Parelaphostrongylus tenuis]|uniref:Uncharacterized protein n=1 Tax=Parelaphostrongylus tenuis TaxID=148309 RepID=A0AAD5MXA3_PARTN|nr:hypothetical protein KIN20_009014 [Parelaphostrongylus tenuis]